MYIFSKDGERILLPLPLRAPMNESNYKMYNIFENDSSHIYFKIHSRCTQLNYFFKIFSEKNNLESHSNNIEQRYMHHTIDNACGMYYNTFLLYLKYYTTMFEHGFLPLINDYSFKHPFHPR